MIRLINERDPKRIQPKHMANKDILVRGGEEVFVAKVFIIADNCYIYKWGISRKLETYDGWAPLPIENIDEKINERNSYNFLFDD